MQSLVISLSSAVDRRQHIENEFALKGVNFEFFDAITPDLARQLANDMNLIIDDELLTAGELACLMSHVSIWKKIVDENIPYLAVFEDDIYLGEDAAKIFSSSDWLQVDWDIIKTESFADKVFLGKDSTSILNGKRQVTQLLSKNLGTAGYILSIKGAQVYLEYIKSSPLIPIDQIMFSEFILKQKTKVYQLCPAICIQEMILFPKQKTVLSSDLIQERNIRLRKNKKKGWAKVQLEIMRIVKQLKFAILGTFIGYK